MAYYLIDFENVKSRGMEGVELLTEEDTVCIFYSDNADSMTFDLHRKLNETKISTYGSPHRQKASYAGCHISCFFKRIPNACTMEEILSGTTPTHCSSSLHCIRY